VPVDAAAVAEEVLSARRYRWLAPELVVRVARDETPKTRSRAEAVKRTKRRLHQVVGAYATEIDVAGSLAQLRAAAADGEAALRQACKHVMARHASTRERLPAINRFYREIFAVTGAPARLLDVACGLGPLATPWMGLPSGASYVAYDADRQLVGLVDGFLRVVGVDHRAEVRDVAADPPRDAADVALVLKTVPCLEQQLPGSGRRLLAGLDASWLVVSYPTRSLGGAGKGMITTYRAQFQALASGLGALVAEMLFPNELVFVADRRSFGGGQAPALQPRSAAPRRRGQSR